MTGFRPWVKLQALWRRVFTFSAVLIAGLVVVTVLTVSNRFDDPDLWWHLKLGQIIATTHSIPSADWFSFTAAGHPWIAHEWLAELSMYAAYAAGGYQGLLAWLAVLASLVFVLVYFLCRVRTNNALVSFLGGLSAWLFGTVSLAVRPLILGSLFLVVELLLLELGRTRSRRWLFCLPPLFAVWVNCHGSYLFGMAVLALYWISSYASGNWGLIVSEAWDRERRNTLGLMLAISAVALCCNPIGIRLVLYPLNLFFRQPLNVGSVEEWLPPDLRGPRAIGMLGAVTGIFLVSLLRRSPLRLRELALVLVAFALAVLHARMLFLFGIIVSPVLCETLAPLLGRSGKGEHPIANAVIVLGSVAAVVWAFPASTAIRQQVRKQSPVAAVEYILRAGLPGPMLNEYVFGGYLIWALPEEKVFIDGRTDVFEWTGILAEYGRWATLSEDPNLLLDKHHIRLCLLSKNAPIGRVFPYLQGWHKAYSDDVAAVFVR